MAFEDQTGERPPWTREQRIGVVLLSIFAILAVGLGILQIRNSMYAPFSLNSDITSSITQKMDQVSALHYRDTDKDGINDFDELYAYLTSPYLADSDSDGLTDKQELDAGKNPLCAEGRECEMAAVPVAAEIIAVVTSTPGADITAEMASFLQDPKKVRELLKERGMDAELLKKISDEDLLKMVGDMLSTSSVKNP